MNRLTLASMMCALLTWGVASFAAEADALMKEKGCTTCHATDKKKLGPSLKSVAEKYQGNAQAREKLVAMLKAGKAHPEVKASDAELNTMVSAILAM